MKNLLILILCGLAIGAGAAAPTIPPPPPATQAQVNAGTSTRSFVSPATLAGAGVSNGVVLIGTGANIIPLTATNGEVSMNSFPLIGRVSWITYNTNALYVSGAGSGTSNARYSITNGGAYLKNAGSVTITNKGSGVFGLGTAPNYNTYSNISAIVTTDNAWIVGVGVAPAPTVTWETSAVFYCYGTSALTNALTGWTNGLGGQFFSNGTSFKLTSRVGATNQTIAVDQAAP